MKKPELLAPAGNLEKMKIAFKYGADAVYFGLSDFSLRARIGSLTVEELLLAGDYCKKNNKNFYLTFNIYPHDRHFKKLLEALKVIEKLKPNGLIVSDPGIIDFFKKELPNIPLHLSTQANTINSYSADFWQKQGVSRIILARELNLDEIGYIKKRCPNLELECFVHGAMCMAYSGRCILSSWMVGRSANLGDCAQPCRWKFNKLTDSNSTSKINKEGEIVESVEFIDDKKRFILKVEEDQDGTYLFNSFDLKMLNYLEKVVATGVDSLKIEGRSKSVYYTAIVVRAYRLVLDGIFDLRSGKISKEDFSKILSWQDDELNSLSNRGYWTGFFMKDQPPHLFDKASFESEREFCGICEEGENSFEHWIFVHNSLKKGDSVEAIFPTRNESLVIEKILTDENVEIDSAHGGLNKKFKVSFDRSVEGNFLLRGKK